MRGQRTNDVLLLLRVGRRCGSTHMSKDRVNRQPSYEVLTGPTERPVAHASEAKITRTRTRIPPPVKIYPTVIVCTLLLVLRSCRRCRHRGRTLYLRTLCDLIARSLSDLCARARDGNTVWWFAEQKGINWHTPRARARLAGK